jgi:hypothetical protein
VSEANRTVVEPGSTSAGSILNRLDQALHNGGVGKGDRQSEIIKLLLCKVQLSRKPRSQKALGQQELKAQLNALLGEVRLQLPELSFSDIQLDNASTSAAWNVFSGMDSAAF